MNKCMFICVQELACKDMLPLEIITYVSILWIMLDFLRLEKPVLISNSEITSIEAIS